MSYLDPLLDSISEEAAAVIAATGAAGIAASLDDSSNADFPAFAAVVEVYYNTHAFRAQASPELRDLYTKRSAIDWLLGQIWKNYDYNDADVNERKQQQYTNLMQLRELVEGERARVESRIAANRGPAIGQITTQAPLESPAGIGGDPNNRYYRGDPMHRLPYRNR